MPNQENWRWEDKVDGKLLLEITTRDPTPDAPSVGEGENPSPPERVLEKFSFQRTAQGRVAGKRTQGLIRPTAEQLSFFGTLNIQSPQHNN